MAQGTGRGELLSIWFFVGVMTLAYGIVLVPYGAWEWITHHPPTTVAFGTQFHPTFWWGLLLLVFGLFYTLKYRPRSEDKDKT